MLIQLQDCTVTYGDEVLFKPEYGVFDMIIGQKIISAYARCADHHFFANTYDVSEVKTIKQAKLAPVSKLEQKYRKVRKLREARRTDESALVSIWECIKEEYPLEWLLVLKVLEVTKDQKLKATLTTYSEDMARKNDLISTLIHEGLEILEVGR